MLMIILTMFFDFIVFIAYMGPYIDLSINNNMHATISNNGAEGKNDGSAKTFANEYTDDEEYNIGYFNSFFESI